jgi:hypothetical protein
MTRRELLFIPALLSAAAPDRVAVPIHRITDAKARFPSGALSHFWTSIWPEAARDFARGGIDLATTDGPGEITHTAADRALFGGLRRGALNLILTSQLPLYWYNARALPGATTLDRGYHLSVIALRYAHGDRVPFLSVNTCVHEILHAVLGDIFTAHPSAFRAGSGEYRVDAYATRLWLFHDGAAVRRAAQAYVARLAADRAHR